ncbi:MAG: hypothetical protein KDD61_06580 [Bdellovibrionales bacterium]|nr:hypothetical protein [Bdellovibrionales bacterium]
MNQKLILATLLSIAMSTPALARGGKAEEGKGKAEINKADRRSDKRSQVTDSQRAQAIRDGGARAAEGVVQAFQAESQSSQLSRTEIQSVARKYQIAKDGRIVESSFKDSVDNVRKARKDLDNSNANTPHLNAKKDMVEAVSNSMNVLMVESSKSRDVQKSRQLAEGIATLGHVREFLELNRAEDLETINRMTEIARSLEAEAGNNRPYDAAMVEYAKRTNQTVAEVKRVREDCK